MKAVRKSIGSEDAHLKVFDKVFRKDIERLMGLKEMWKTRTPPELLDLAQIQEQAASIPSTISTQDQKVWSLAEDFTVFKDR